MLIRYFLFASFFCVNIVFAQTTQETSKSSEKEYTQDSVEKLPEYPGGDSAFRGAVLNNIDPDSIHGVGMLRTEVTFIIEKDGSISNIKAIGKNQSLNEAAEKAVKSVKGKWIPAQNTQKPVKYRFRLPIQKYVDEED